MAKHRKTNEPKQLQKSKMTEQQFCLEQNAHSKFLSVSDHAEHVNDACPWSPYQIWPDPGYLNNVNAAANHLSNGP